MNKVMLIGNVGQDPEVRYVDQGVAVARILLATTERVYTLQNGTQVPDHTYWHNVILWRRLAEIVEKYVHKGDKLYIEGRIRYTSYDDKQGQRRYATAIWADNMKYLNLRSNEEFGATIEAYTYPDEFAECCGSSDVVPGLRINQQPRKTFGFSYRSKIGNAEDQDEHGYKIHIV